MTYINKTQTGATLFIGLVLLLAISILSLAAMRTSVLDLVIANNKQQFSYAFEAAEQIGNERLVNFDLSITGLEPINLPLPNTQQNAVVTSKNNDEAEITVANVNSQVSYRGEGTTTGWGLGAGSAAYHFEMDITAQTPGRGATANHQVGFVIAR